jgi:HSP20 family protein
MALIRWEPAAELNTIQTEMNRLFNSLFDSPTRPSSGEVTRRWVPAIDLVEAEDHYILHADLPGVSDQDISVEVDAGVLTIAGERKRDRTESGSGYRRIERSYGSFKRTLTLPDGVDADAVRASFDRGVLEVRIPKPEQIKPRKVAVAVGSGATPAVESGQAAPDSGDAGATGDSATAA